MLSLGQSLLHAPSLNLLQGCSGSSWLRCLDSGTASCISRQASRQPKSAEHHLPVAVVVVCSLGWHHSWPQSLCSLRELAGACLEHLRTVSNAAHSQLARTRRWRSEGQEGPSAISALQWLPSFPYPVPTFPNFGNQKENCHGLTPDDNQAPHSCSPTTLIGRGETIEKNL